MIKIITTIIAAMMKMFLRFIRIKFKGEKLGCEKSINKKGIG
jgi:hypothetical protein